MELSEASEKTKEQNEIAISFAYIENIYKMSYIARIHTDLNDTLCTSEWLPMGGRRLGINGSNF